MTTTEAIRLMETAVTVQDWNTKREICKELLTPDEWTSLYRMIDQNGMIVRVLKANQA